MNAGIPILFRSYASTNSAYEHCTIWQAARATSANDLFHPMMIGRGQLFVDGELGCNNPTKILLEEAVSLFPAKSISCIVSVGSGHPDTIRMTLSMPALNTYQRLAWDSEATHEDVSRRFEACPNLYFRFNVQQGLQSTNVPDFATLQEAEAHAPAYINTHAVQERLKTLAATMLAGKGKIAAQHLGKYV